MSRQTQSDARRAYLVSLKTKKAIDKREADKAKVVAKAEPKKAPTKKADLDE